MGSGVEERARLGLARLLVGRGRRLHRLQRLGQAARERGHVVAQPLALQLLPAKVHGAVAVVDLHLRSQQRSAFSSLGRL